MADLGHHRRQWPCPSAFIVKCEHVSDIVLIVDFELPNVF